MNNPKYKIGDSLYVASLEKERHWITCPDCGGTKFIRCILFDETEVTVDCGGCSSGYNPPSGQVIAYDWVSKIERMTISGIEVNEGQPIEYRARLSPNCSRVLAEDDLFETKEAALIRSVEIVVKHNIAEQERINKKEKDTCSWAWNVHYHRKQIRDAEKTIVYATDKLNAAKRHVKGD